MLKCLWPNMNEQSNCQLASKKLLKLGVGGLAQMAHSTEFWQRQLSAFEQVPCPSGWWFQPIWKILYSQNGNLPQVGVKKKNVSNHHLVIHFHGNLRAPPQTASDPRRADGGPTITPKHWNQRSNAQPPGDTPDLMTTWYYGMGRLSIHTSCCQAWTPKKLMVYTCFSFSKETFSGAMLDLNKCNSGSFSW